MTDTGELRRTGIVVRQARGEDLEPMKALGLIAFPATYAGVIEPELIHLLLARWWTSEALIPAIRQGKAFVAHDGDELVGLSTFGAQDGTYVVWKLYVHPDAHGRGVGGALLAAVRERAAQDEMPVRLAFTDGNRHAEAFGLRHGFIVSGREEQVGLPDLVWMGEA